MTSYLQWGTLFFLNKIFKSEVMHLPLDFSDIIKSQLLQMVDSVKLNKGKTHIFLFTEAEFEQQQDFIELLNKRIGPFQEYIWLLLTL